MQQPMSLYLLKWCHCLSIKLSQFNGIFNCNQFELFKVSSLIRLESLMVTDDTATLVIIWEGPFLFCSVEIEQK